MTVTQNAQPVQIQFDPDQEFQRDAIQSVVDLFRGQTLAPSQFEVADLGGPQGALISDTGFGNNVVVAEEQVRANLDLVQKSNSIPDAHRGLAEDAVDTLVSWDFSVEMETGTGKTYVYLRTAVELNQEYGFTKFAIVVPSVAIREGVEQNLALLKEHFASIYDGVQYGVVKYDSKDLARLRGFANANSMQFLIINIDAFNKTDTNKIHDANQDSMMGRAPIDFIRACNPIVILDEPQNMETDTAKRAIATLNPAVTLRYSATHRNRYHQIYRLTPVDAYQLGLVKRISVWSVTEELNGNKPYVKVLKITAKKASVTAQLEVATVTDQGLKKKRINASGGSKPTDLQAVTNLDNYYGYVVEDINADGQYVEFANGVMVEVGEAEGASRDELQRAQIRAAIADHLDRELDFHKRSKDPGFSPTKVLTLFFIDKVDNYVPDNAKFRRWFIDEYLAAKAKPKYRDLDLPDVDLVHDGYFATDKKGVAKNTNGTSADDATAYEKIMTNKQLLLSTQEPLRFIFSHSALREGWDNPNVFVICTLNDTVSETKKRQEIGRGLRLPVAADGTRQTDPQVAKLTIVANEAYEEFATALQQEIETETGERFSKSLVENARADRTKVRLNDNWQSDLFTDLWAKIQHRTSYRVEYSTEELITKAAARLRDKPALAGAKIRTIKSAFSLTDEGITTQVVAEKTAVNVETSYPIPDLLGNLTRLVPVSRSTIAQILIKSNRLGEVTTNPQQFIEQARDAIDHALAELLVTGIKYEKRGTGPDALYEMSLFLDDDEREELTSRVYEVADKKKSPLSHVVWDSDTEAEIAARLDAHEDIKMFVKLPRWFLIDTPVGKYNPDWAYIKQEDDGEQRLYLVRESKPTQDTAKLRPTEKLKVDFGYRHFEALAPVDFGVIDSPDQV